MIRLDLLKEIEINEIEYLKSYFIDIKKNKTSLYKLYVDKLKVLFINSNDILIIDKIAMLFKELKVHSSVPLIVSKLLTYNFKDNGGTLIYSLNGLKILHFIDDLQTLWKHNISYEMQQMLYMIGVDEE